ncbi:MAG: ribosomal protein S18-alanine N-acetyltransferase [Chloroflexi bacterium]|nr:ribosomal protein S18-alanine N-acetyltransferase [Chloroflexota bacterium]
MHVTTHQVTRFPTTITDLSALPFRIDAMQMADIPYVMAIERRVFPMAWTSGIYQRELAANPWSHYYVLRSNGRGLPHLLAYGGVWQIDQRAHIPTIATHPDFMGRKLGGYLLANLLLVGYQVGCREAILEVRVSNEQAQALYRRFQFESVGRRRRYYSDNQEDALIMTRPNLTAAALEQEHARVSRQLLMSWQTKNSQCRVSNTKPTHGVRNEHRTP